MGNCQSANAVDPTAVHGANNINKPSDKSASTQPVSDSGASNGEATSLRQQDLPHLHHHEDPTTTDTVASEDHSHGTPPSPVTITQQQQAKLKKTNDWKRGYSSGASSSDGMNLSPADSASEDDDNDNTSSSRPPLDPLHLISMRNIMHENGDLTASVVRLETAFGQPIETIYEGVHDGPFLGEGVAGMVRMVTHRVTKVQYACKILDIGLITTEAGLRQLRDEISIMCQLDHPNIVRIEEVYESTNTIYLLQELCLGGDLFDRLEEQPDFHYTEVQCAKLVKQMVSAVRYLHSKGVVHRDLKLENFLFSTQGPDSQLKMIDFGLSKHFDLDDRSKPLTDAVGTPYTVCPEVIRGSYDEKADIWSVGVITYLLLSGETPFGGCDGEPMAGVRRNILCGKFTFQPEDVWAQVSPKAKLFVTRLLCVDPKQRPTAKEVQRDEWLQTYARMSSSAGEKLSPKIVDALVSFKEYGEMRRLLHEVLSFTLLPDQIIELREEFEKIDSDGDGEITLEAMKQVLTNSAGAGALGGLSEAEVEDIFDALRVNKNDSTIRWHEFIAAGLSQCKVDDRNLQLAFDRFDTDRKGYISFDDLADLLGHSPETLANLKTMWADSMNQCSCKHGRIAYDDFLVLMKGQTRRASERPSIVWSPQAAAALNADFSDSDDDDDDAINPSGFVIESSHTIPPTIQEDVEEETSARIEPTHYRRKRSQSFNDAKFDDLMNRRISFPPRVRPRPSVAADGADLVQLVAADAKAPLIATREEYKRFRDLRNAIYQASKEFDTKSQARRAEIEGKKATNPCCVMQGAGLIMKRGTQPPPELECEHQRMLFDAAVRRGGRHAHHTKSPGPRRRKRVQSDITGMLM